MFITYAHDQNAKHGKENAPTDVSYEQRVSTSFISSYIINAYAYNKRRETMNCKNY